MCERCQMHRLRQFFSSDRSSYCQNESVQASDSSRAYGREQPRNRPHTESVITSCLQICGTEFSGKSCAKNILLRVYPEGQPQYAQFMYAIVDNQSNRSLVKSDFFMLLNIVHRRLLMREVFNSLYFFHKHLKISVKNELRKQTVFKDSSVNCSMSFEI